MSKLVSMNKRGSRRYRPETVFLMQGDPEGIKLLLLNLNDEDEISAVIRKRVRNMNEVDRAIERNGGTKALNLYHTMVQPDRKKRKELLKHGFDDSFIKLMTAIQRECYEVRMRASYPVEGRWQLDWGFPLPETRPVGANGFVLSASLAIIHDLAAKGLLRRVRECATCGRWFYAYRPGQRYRFCSDACRDKHWRQTPQGRARRAKYTRDYRRRLEEADKAFQKAR
jgi:hypothetical protein